MRVQHTAWALVVVAMACSSSNTSGGGAAAGGATTAAATSTSGGTETSGATATTPTAGGAAVAWPQMNHEQKMEYMEHTVMPEMRRMFQEHDAQRFANFTCRTCHGANAREVNFHMPNGISPLNPAAIPGMFQSQDRMHVFMTQRLWPRMTELLGAQPYNPQTHQGFGCLGCHGMAGAAPAAAATH
jgi:hypothetical protein